MKTILRLQGLLLPVLLLATLTGSAQLPNPVIDPFGTDSLIVLDTLVFENGECDSMTIPHPTGVNASCNKCDGMYIYSVSCNDHIRTDTFKNLCPGTYNRLIIIKGDPDRDISDMHVWGKVIITQAPGPAVTLSRTNATCGQCDGSATVQASGGTPPYTYSWPGGVLSGLCPGTYWGTVTDSKGCTQTFSVDIGGCLTDTAADTVVTEARAGNSAQETAEGVFPNPFSDRVRVCFYSARTGTAVITLHNETGHTERRISAPVMAGKNTVLLDGQGLAPGIHIVRVALPDRVIRLKALRRQ